MENLHIGGSQGALVTFQNDDKSYRQMLNIRSLNPTKLFPQNQMANSKNRHLSILVDPIQFEIHPASKVIAKPGSDIQIQLQFAYRNILRKKSKSGQGSAKIKVYQYGFDIESDSPYFHGGSWPLFEQGNDQAFVDAEARKRYSVEFREEDLGNNEVRVFLNLLITDVQPNDQSFLLFEITKHPVKHMFHTELIIEPNTEMFPEGYLGVQLQNYMAVPAKDKEAPLLLYKGQQSLGVCTGIGNVISDVYLTKDGKRLDATDDDRYSSQKVINKGITRLEFESKNITESDAGEYSCVVEGPSGSVQQDMSFIVAERVSVQLDIPWWNATVVRLCCIHSSEY